MAKIKDLEKVDLPREKLAKYGSGKLKDHSVYTLDPCFIVYYSI